MSRAGHPGGGGPELLPLTGSPWPRWDWGVAPAWDSGLLLLLWRLDQPCPGSWRAALSPEEETRAARYLRPRDQHRFRVGRGGLRAALGALLGLEPAALALRTEARGRPYLAGHPLHFNLSHSGGVALLGVQRERPLGVDLEHCDRSLDRDLVARTVFGPEERSEIAAAADSRRAFFELWTRKEAWLKAEGSGLAAPLKQIRMRAGAAPACLAEPGGRPERWWISSHEPAPGFLAATAQAGPARAVSCWQL